MTKPDLTWVYWTVGFMILSNLGTILAIIIYAGRGLWWLSKLDARVDGNTKDVHAAHLKIRELHDYKSRAENQPTL